MNRIPSRFDRMWHTREELPLTGFDDIAWLRPLHRVFTVVAAAMANAISPGHHSVVWRRACGLGSTGEGVCFGASSLLQSQRWPLKASLEYCPNKIWLTNPTRRR